MYREKDRLRSASFNQDYGDLLLRTRRTTRRGRNDCWKLCKVEG